MAHEMQDVIVSAKHIGTRDDQVDMERSGRKQDTKRVYSLKTIAGFVSNLIATPEVILTGFQLGLANGGTAGMFWGFLFVVAGFSFVYASLSELTSMQATAGGQYEWTSMLAPKRFQRYLSFQIGWLGTIGWQSGITAIAFLISGAIQGLIALLYNDYTWARWHTALIAIAVDYFAAVINIFAARQVPAIEGVLVLVRPVGILAVFIVLWVLAAKNNAYNAFFQFSNNGGWSLDGMAFMISLTTQVVALLGFESISHMCEETKDAGRTVPRSIMFAFMFNGALGLIAVITLIFTCGDLEEITSSPYGFSIISVIYNATDSKAATTVCTLLIILPLFGSEVAVVATASRQSRAFSRDRGLPLSAYIDKISPEAAVPVNAILASSVGCTLLSLVNIGSSTALNAFLALNAGCLLGSYIVPIACLVLKRIGGEDIPSRKWSLGRYGLFVNIVALCWLLLVFVFAMFPSSLPVEPITMNWGSLMFGSTLVSSTAYYVFKGRRVYTAPIEKARIV